RPTARSRTNRKGDNVKSSLSESSHGAGHVVGGGHQQKSSFWRRMNQTGSEARVLFGRSRMFLDQDPLSGDPKRDKILFYDSRLARPRRRGIRAPGVNDPSLGVTTGQVGDRRHRLSILFEIDRTQIAMRDSVVRSAEDNDAVGALGGEAGIRKALLQRRQQHVSEWRQRTGYQRHQCDRRDGR